MTFDPTLPVQTRDGRKARIACDDRKHISRPIVALIENDNQESVRFYAENGHEGGRLEESNNDLINIPEKRWAILLDDFTWVQTYCPTSPGQVIPTSGPKVRCLACLEFTEGDGL